LGAGLAAKEQGELRLTLDIVRGFGFEASHDTTQGLSASGQVTTVPAHRHDVGLDVTRLEIGAQYAVDDDWDLWLRVPYDIKERRASISLIDPATPSEQADMQRNLELHHGTDTLHGFGDANILVAHSLSGLFAAEDLATVAFGASVPTGRTEDDPFVAGAEGRSHEHIQFGNGTFDPLLELYYSNRLSSRFGGTLFGFARVPLYKNDHDYRGAPEVTVGGLISYTTTSWLTLRAGLSGFYQGYAYWDGARDINTGLLTSAALIGGELSVGSGVFVSLNVTVPMSQQTLSDSGDTFEQGPLLSLTTSYSF